MESLFYAQYYKLPLNGGSEGGEKRGGSNGNNKRGRKSPRDVGWDIFKSILKSCELTSGTPTTSSTATGCGFAALSDVRKVGSPHMDRLDTFVFAETFKYAFLLFGEDEDSSTIPRVLELDEWVLTTEAHPLRIIG